MTDNGESAAGEPVHDVVVQQRLTIVPIGLRAANEFVGEEHRHHPPSRGHKFSVAVHDEDGNMRGVAIAGRPVNRSLDDGLHLEVLRVATDGCPNACSALYGAVARAGKGMGYPLHNILTYTLESEPGTSLRAAGWLPLHTTKAESWDRPNRSRTDKHPTVPKIRWHASRPPDSGRDVALAEASLTGRNVEQ